MSGWLRVVFFALACLFGSHGFQSAACFAVSNADMIMHEVREELKPKLDEQVCGRFALYSYLHFLRKGVSYQQVCEAVPISARGSSLLELREGAKNLGVSLEICKVSPTDPGVPHNGPLIAHMRKTRVSADRFEEPTYDGHFIVVLPPSCWRNSHEIDAIDGTSGLIETYSYNGFPKLWTGYYLVERRSGYFSSPVDGALFVINILMATVVFTNRQRCKEIENV